MGLEDLATARDDVLLAIYTCTINDTVVKFLDVCIVFKPRNREINIKLPPDARKKIDGLQNSWETMSVR